MDGGTEVEVEEEEVVDNGGSVVYIYSKVLVLSPEGGD